MAVHAVENVAVHGERWHALDAVRAGALLLGVVFHATMSFVPGQQIWMTRDRESPLLGGVFVVSHIFRMSLFFLIAGFFGHMAFHRRGLRGFLRDRLKRIALPLLAFWPISFVTVAAVFVWGVVSQHGVEGAKAMAPPPGGSFVESFPWTHLWFLYVLLWFYAAVLLVRAGAVALDRSGGLRGRLDALVRMLLTSGLLPLVLAAPTCLALYLRRDWLLWAGVPAPDHGLVPNAASLVAFGTAFAFGWLLRRQAELLRVFERRFAAHLLVALAATGVCLAIGGVTATLDPASQPAAHDPWLRLAAAVCYPLAIWSWSFGLIGLALRFLSREHAGIRYLADASYWIYLVHLPIVMALQVVVFRLPAPALVKWALVLLLAFPTLLLSYQWLVRYSFIGAILNGRRRPRPARGRRVDAALAPAAE